VLEQRAGPVSADSLVCLKRAGPAAQHTQPNWRRAGWPCRSAAYLSMIVVDRRPIKRPSPRHRPSPRPPGTAARSGPALSSALRIGITLPPGHRSSCPVRRGETDGQYYLATPSARLSRDAVGQHDVLPGPGIADGCRAGRGGRRGRCACAGGQCGHRSQGASACPPARRGT